MLSQPSPGKIYQLELQNFKSYQGFQEIGPFEDFTAIIGPKGAGKSNLMDAISFVLGVRGAQLRDLIYASDDREKEQMNGDAFVRMVYLLDSGSKILFTRTITSAGDSEYQIDQTVVNWDTYNAKLTSLGILVESGNFRVFQGDVESIASKNSRELTVWLEQISGLEEIKRRYEELEKEKARAEEKKALAYHRKKTKELEHLKHNHFLWQLFTIGSDVLKVHTDLTLEEERQRKIVDELEKYENEVREKEKELSGYMRKVAVYGRKIADKIDNNNMSQTEILKKIESTSKELEKRQGEKQNFERGLDIIEQLNKLHKKSQDTDGKLQLAHLVDSQLEKYCEIAKVGIDRIKHKIEEYENAISGRTKMIPSLEERINGIVDPIYKRFSAFNIHEYEKTHEEILRRCVKLLCSLENQQSKFEIINQLEDKQMEVMNSRIAELEATLDKLKNDLPEVHKSLKSTKKRDKHYKEKVTAWKSNAEDCEKDIQEWQKKISAAKKNISELNHEIKSKNAQIEELYSRKQEILEKCQLEHISIETTPVFDFNKLCRAIQGNDNPEKVEKEFAKKIDTLMSDIQRTALNLEALDQYEALRQKEDAVTKEFEDPKNEEKKVTDEYNRVKEIRYQLFMKAFNHISGNIHKIYNQLTKSSPNSLGGTAYLNLDNVDEPYLHGIKYTAMPPTKSNCEMEHLSGEKTVAALALLFAIHSFRPSPFLILDEVDASLDDLNAAMVAEFIRSKSCGRAQRNVDTEEGCGFQSIVISSKDRFYDKAEALVGVYRDFYSE